jgi:hypothetical protein
VFVLRPTDRSTKFIAPDQVDSVVKTVLNRVEDETGEKPADYNVFGNLGSFIVDAPREFIQKLTEQREIESAVANVQSQSVTMPLPKEEQTNRSKKKSSPKTMRSRSTKRKARTSA